MLFRSLFVALYVDAPVALKLDDARCRPVDMLDCVRLDTFSFSVVYTAGWVECLCIRRDQTDVVLSTRVHEIKVQAGELGRLRVVKPEVKRTANSSRVLYRPFSTFFVIVPKSMGCLMTSVYPGTCDTSTGARKNA